MSVDGILIVDKPTGMTSHDVVARVRRAIKIKRVGHAGTLDPDAVGVLVVAVGAATRLLPYLPIEPKEYIAEIRFGVSTSTEDASGVEISRADASGLTMSRLLEVIPSFLGQIQQVPPMVSAVHHDGRRLYELAREGLSVDRIARDITVHEIIADGFVPGVVAQANLRVSCGGGAYIRTLCADLGEALGIPAHMGSLRRERVGRFSRSAALRLEDLVAGGEPMVRMALIPMHLAIDLPLCEVSDADVTQLTLGRSISGGGATDLATMGAIGLLNRERLVSLAHLRDGMLLPFRVFCGPGSAGIGEG